MFGLKRRKKILKDSNWRKLEKEIETHKILNGYTVKPQKTSHRTKERPDIFGINPKNNKDRIIVDAKCVKEVTSEHINQVKNYKRTFFAKKGAIITCKDAKIPHQKRREAKDANIKIIRGKTKRKKGFFGF